MNRTSSIIMFSVCSIALFVGGCEFFNRMIPENMHYKSCGCTSCKHKHGHDHDHHSHHGHGNSHDNDVAIKINNKVIAFWHPKPFWQEHIVLVPRKPIKSLTSISEDDLKYIAEIYKVIQEIVIELKWDKSGYSVLINGGNRQEINQIHFHLFSGDEI